MLKEVTFGVTFFLLAITLTSAERPEAFKRFKSMNDLNSNPFPDPLMEKWALLIRLYNPKTQTLKNWRRLAEVLEQERRNGALEKTDDFLLPVVYIVIELEETKAALSEAREMLANCQGGGGEEGGEVDKPKKRSFEQMARRRRDW